MSDGGEVDKKSSSFELAAPFRTTTVNYEPDYPTDMMGGYGTGMAFGAPM